MATITVGPILENEIYKNGFKAMQSMLGMADLFDFPKRTNGTSMLLKQSFFERLFGGEMVLIDFPGADVIGAQTDVKQLSLPQLLRIRCDNLDFAATTPGARAQADFLTSVDENLDKRIIQKLTSNGVVIDPAQTSEVVRLVLFIYGVYQQIGGEEGPRSSCWLVRAPPLEAILNVRDCELSVMGDRRGFL